MCLLTSENKAIFKHQENQWVGLLGTPIGNFVPSFTVSTLDDTECWTHDFLFLFVLIMIKFDSWVAAFEACCLKKLVMQLFSFSDFRLCGPEIFDGLDNFQCRFFKALSHSYKLAKGSRVWPTGHDGPWPFELHKYNLRSLRSLQGFACHGPGIDSIY